MATNKNWTIILGCLIIAEVSIGQYRERLAFLLDSNWQQYIDCTPLCSMDTIRYGAGGPHGVRRHYSKKGLLLSAFTYCNRKNEGPQFTFDNWDGSIAAYYYRHNDYPQGISIGFANDKPYYIKYVKLLDTVIRTPVQFPDGIKYMETNWIHDKFYKRFDKGGRLCYAVEVKDDKHDGLEVFLTNGTLDSVRLLNMGEIARKLTDAEIFAATDPSLPPIEESKRIKIDIMPVLDFIEEPTDRRRKSERKPLPSCELCAKIKGG